MHGSKGVRHHEQATARLAPDCGDKVFEFLGVTNAVRDWHSVTDKHSEPPRLLCARRERPSCRAAEHPNDCAAIHSITSSARASSLSGTVRPRILAVWWLMTSSSLVDCTTGRSSGLGALEDVADIDADLTISIHNV